MKKGLTNVVFILDRSGSMQGIWGDAEGAYKQFLADQRKIPGEMLMTLVLFDDKYEIVQDMVPLKDAHELRPEDGPRGSTALVDACCRTIDHIGQKLAAMPEDERPEVTVVAIMTDGQENASREFKSDDLKQRVQHQTDAYQWRFLFLGANQDSFATAHDYGIHTKGVMNFAPDHEGMVNSVQCMSRSVGSTRMHDASGDGRLIDVQSGVPMVTSKP